MNGSISPWRSWKATSISVMARSATCNRKSTGAPTRDGRWLRPRKYRMRCGPRLKFVAWAAGRRDMAALCGRFGVSRTTACKILQRHNSRGLAGRPIVAAALPTCQPAPRSDRDAGRTQQAGALWAASRIRRGWRGFIRIPAPSHQYGACGSGPPWAGQAQGRRRNKATRHTAIDLRSAQ